MPLAKGTGVLLSKPSDPLVFPRNFNRVSGPDANGCISCHNLPYGIAGGSGDFVATVIEFLKSLQVLPPGAQHLIVDEHGKPKAWPPSR